MDETAEEAEVPDEQQQALSEGLQFAYTVPSSTTSNQQQVCITGSFNKVAMCMKSVR